MAIWFDSLQAMVVAQAGFVSLVRAPGPFGTIRYTVLLDGAFDHIIRSETEQDAINQFYMEVKQNG